MKTVIDPRLPHVLVAQAPHGALPGACALMLFGGVAAVGGINCFVTQPAAFRIYAIILLVLGTPSLGFGVTSLFRRTRFSFDRAAGTLTIEHAGLFGATRATEPLETLAAVVLVRYWLFNRVARATDDFSYRLQLRGAPASTIELAPKLSEAAATRAAEAIASFVDLPVERREGRVEGVIAGR